MQSRRVTAPESSSSRPEPRAQRRGRQQPSGLTSCRSSGFVSRENGDTHETSCICINWYALGVGNALLALGAGSLATNQVLLLKRLKGAMTRRMEAFVIRPSSVNILFDMNALPFSPRPCLRHRRIGRYAARPFLWQTVVGATGIHTRE